jgi:hypothetical protein
MSMIANELLREAVIERDICDPGEILTEIHRRIRISLKQEENANGDGMDVAICVFDESRKTLEYAGAKNPLIYWDGQALQEIKATNFSIGGTRKQNGIGFASHQVPIRENHRFYLFSDGYQDQFGGSHKRKYMKKRLKENLAFLLYPTHARTAQTA